jgi:hypothetical protein
LNIVNISGEFNDSFAYTSSGKKMSKTNDELIEESYGESFGLSDVLGCYIDFGDNSEDNLIRISFTKNGEDYGQAFEFSKTNLNEFHPHILVKNAKFECNFGHLVSILVFNRFSYDEKIHFLCISLGTTVVRNET